MPEPIDATHNPFDPVSLKFHTAYDTFRENTIRAD